MNDQSSPGIHISPQVRTVLDDLTGRDFATVAETAAILEVDRRTIRRYCADGRIPGVRVADWKVPVRWLREQAQVAA